MSTMPPPLAMNSASPPVLLAEEARDPAGVGGDRRVAGAAPLEEARGSIVSDNGVARRGRATPRKTLARNPVSGTV